MDVREHLYLMFGKHLLQTEMQLVKTANYWIFSVIALDDATGIHVQNQTIELNFMTEEDGFYFGIRDGTSCFSLSNVIV